ncbi:hypothetical protein MARLIPOL_01135 [Marinobacter lipolyticus SM19]|uniref:DUF86 domain-containing protein n=1 Tax=Marinobacter lipolyticus SM19 TaxID=1318628 RepID=R8B5K1_9GAMM|nr:HepT-like ribonuclease domain-containing protein [Marinobacter lipolyticus]EON93890.1 hypothetical protein MARLIPOL_01135 [Marinobacter lipolyticus SM19]
MQREAKKYLYDIKVAADKIRRFTDGEAVGKLHKSNSEVAERIPDYRKMISFRNILIHGYATVDPVIVWGVVEENLGGGGLLCRPGVV